MSTSCLYFIILYAKTLQNVTFFKSNLSWGHTCWFLGKQRRTAVISVRTWSHQHSEKLGNWCSRLYSRNSNMTLIIIHIHQSRIIRVWGRKESKRGGWVAGGGEWCGVGGGQQDNIGGNLTFFIAANATEHTGAVNLFHTAAGWGPWLSVYYRKDSSEVLKDKVISQSWSS